MQIREEKPDDYRIVQNLTREAFWNLYEKGCSQHYLVHIIRSSEDFIQPLSLVVQQNGQIIGHILYTRSKILYSDNTIRPTITFGPVCVHPDHQKKGIGSILIKESLAKAKDMGFKAVVITGSPAVYNRFGFKCTKQFNITSESDNYPAGLMALELEEGYFPKDKQGMISMSPAYNVTAEDCEEYDKTFLPKKKHYTLSQKVFNSVINLQWKDKSEYSMKDAFDRRQIQEEK